MEKEIDSEEEKLKPRRRTKTAADRAYDEAREIIERELGTSLRRSDQHDEVGGSALEEENNLLRQHGYQVWGNLFQQLVMSSFSVFIENLFPDITTPSIFRRINYIKYNT